MEFLFELLLAIWWNIEQNDTIDTKFRPFKFARLNFLYLIFFSSETIFLLKIRAGAGNGSSNTWTTIMDFTYKKYETKTWAIRQDSNEMK